MIFKLPQFIGIKLHLVEGLKKVGDWVDKYGLPDVAIDEVVDILGLTLKSFWKAIRQGTISDFDTSIIVDELKVWLVGHPLSDEAIDELAGILDFIVEFTGIAGAIIEFGDKKFFKQVLMWAKQGL